MGYDFEADTAVGPTRLGRARSARHPRSSVSRGGEGSSDRPPEALDRAQGLRRPDAGFVRPDGRIFVAEKQGFVVAYRSFADRRPRVIVDISRRVDSFVDRGLLSIALDPDFPLKPYLYLLYSLDAPPGGKPPVWHDGCPTPPGPLLDGCIGTGVLSRVRVSPSDKVGPEHVLIANRWCHQYTSHDIGDLAFGPGRTLYVSAGEGADWAALDWGQRGGRPGSPTPRNPCGDPPGSKTSGRAQARQPWTSSSNCFWTAS